MDSPYASYKKRRGEERGRVKRRGSEW